MLYLIFFVLNGIVFSFINLQWFLSVWTETTVSDCASKIGKLPKIQSFSVLDRKRSRQD